MRYQLLFIASSILFFSCHQSSERETIRRIVNMTEYSLEIKIISEDTLFYAIDPWGSIDIKGVCYGPPDKYCDIGWFNDANYGVIIFNSNRKQEFTESKDCDDRYLPAMPSDYCNGYRLSKEEEISVYTYQVTYEDYRNAELIE